jgi:hypothetical protein
MVATGKRKLQQIEAAETAALTDEQVLRYAYDVGTKFGVTAPDSWTPDSQQRPYPVEAEMRMGQLLAHQAPPLAER